MYETIYDAHFKNELISVYGGSFSTAWHNNFKNNFLID